MFSIQTHFTFTFQNCQCLSTKLISYFNPIHFLFPKLAIFSIHTHFTFQSCPCLESKLISHFNSFHFHFPKLLMFSIKTNFTFQLISLSLSSAELQLGNSRGIPLLGNCLKCHSQGFPTHPPQYHHHHHL